MTSKARIRVLIVEDSAVVRTLLEHAIGADARLWVVGCAGNGEEALRLIRELDPDVVTMDIRLPGMDGFEVTRRIMRDHPLPIVVVASNVDDAALGISMNALRAGALAVVEKPPGTGRADYDRIAGHLCTQLAIMSQVKVVRLRRRPEPQAPPPAPAARHGEYSLVAIVASTGGPGVLARLLGGLPPDFQLPLVVLQHIGAPFVEGFAEWLGSVSALPVEMAAAGRAPRPGWVHVAPGGAHLVLRDGIFALDSGAPVQGQKPSGDVLFTSVAREAGAAAIGMLLTGMGEDGARGLLDLRRAGGYTIAEDATTAVVWGMPGVAVRLGAAIEQLPADALAARLVGLAHATETDHG
ncbi:MAG: chemotaxis-specific protein-glutamate methyltransferase CheB [Pseudomonadota bacterium]